MTTAAVTYAERPLWRPVHSFLLGLILVAISVVGISLPRSGGQLGFLGERTVLAWISIAVLMAAFAAIAGHGVTGRSTGVLIGDLGRLSLSRLQMLLWTVLVLSGYMAAALANIGRGARDPMNVNIPTELWLAMGISTASLVAAPAALAHKQRKQGGTSAPLPEEFDSRFAGLFYGEEDGDKDRVDLGKLQMFFFTVVLILAYALTLGDMFDDKAKKAFTSLPPVDEAVVSLLAISHTGYLVKKAYVSAPADTRP